MINYQIGDAASHAPHGLVVQLQVRAQWCVGHGVENYPGRCESARLTANGTLDAERYFGDLTHGGFRPGSTLGTPAAEELDARSSSLASPQERDAMMELGRVVRSP